MENNLAVIERPLSAIQLREQVNLIQEIMKEVMQDGQHYGLIVAVLCFILRFV